jgi:anti-sigma B factor antagonist
MIMKHSQEIDGDAVTLRLSGQLMGGPDSVGFRDTLLAAIERGFAVITLDMAEVTWVNSAGLGFLINAHLAARAKGCHLRLFRVTKRIASILAITRLNSVFDVVGLETEGREGLATSSSR